MLCLKALLFKEPGDISRLPACEKKQTWYGSKKGEIPSYPLVNIQKTMEHGPVFSLIYLLEVVIFQFAM